MAFPGRLPNQSGERIDDLGKPPTVIELKH
jgi:hypothetical protein